MSASPKGPVAPLSPVLLAGLAMRPLPYGLIQPAFNKAIRQMHENHPDVFDRLVPLGSPRFLIDPIDLPFSFIMDTSPVSPALDMIDADQEQNFLDIKASVRGPLLQLIELLEGRIDGDALFFSRDLIIEGDTEAVLGLRNAVDGADINVHEDLLQIFGPLSRPIDGAAQIAGKIFNRFSKDLNTLSQAPLAPLQKKCDAQAASIQDLEETVATLKKQLRRRNGKTA
ncbi:SCP2 sterol-binding domain-containing protein [Terasakiella sp. A23]|uniref:ubiquinone anaerobic biosynthesis accessory factor UbiT n=1 Tax=Terasakiella sp. FCG-A23 TaxID=3080561 RepID=UPI002953BBA2|nr:SCP2 sterol-binding domain-containing protein [Terasakiella sp. A23]MDV7340209.1 SCP2 sterol-binding domain-containing protein [Terasakiella sp. A23]